METPEQRRIAELEGELKLNASMLARQCDLAREAETQAMEAFQRGYLAAADDLAAPYPVDVFTPMSAEEISAAVDAMGEIVSQRLHSHWARHLAEVLRRRSGEAERENR